MSPRRHLRSSSIPLLESLEPRTLFSASLGSFPLCDLSKAFPTISSTATAPASPASNSIRFPNPALALTTPAAGSGSITGAVTVIGPDSNPVLVGSPQGASMYFDFIGTDAIHTTLPPSSSNSVSPQPATYTILSSPAAGTLYVANPNNNSFTNGNSILIIPTLPGQPTQDSNINSIDLNAVAGRWDTGTFYNPSTTSSSSTSNTLATLWQLGSNSGPSFADLATQS